MGLKMAQKKNKVVIATRGSKLAMWQANWIKTELVKVHRGIEIELRKIKTTGDKILDVPLAKVGGKGLFVKEIEEAMLRGKADLAVHSMKDVPAVLPSELHIGAICKREDPRDAFLAQVRDLPTSPQGPRFKIQDFKSLPKNATVGTSSLRRICQLLHERPDLRIIQLRGNLDTRIRKLDEGQFDAIIVATAGVNRLGLAERITEKLESKICLSAIGQGAVGIECRINDDFINGLIKPLNHSETTVCVRAERAFNKKLEGGCQVPIAAHAQLISERLTVNSSQETNQKEPGCRLPDGNCQLFISGLVGSVTGDRIINGSIEGSPEEPEQLGTQLAEVLLSRGAKEILDEIFKNQ
jgi:hydroxymethylbilane synthase